MSVGVVALIVGAYLLGSFNAATFVARSRGIDIRGHGSGNPGASNVMRLMGKGPAVAVYLVDLAKGFIPALVGALVWDPAVATGAGLAAVVGHCWPVFHRFRGGKGVATGGGVILAVAPLALVALGMLYGILVAVTKISSVGSLIAVVAAVPAAAVAGVGGWALLWLGAMMALVVARHHANIRRLLTRAEHRVVG